jgi:hypothetical protein
VGTSHKALERLVLRDIAFSQLPVKGLNSPTTNCFFRQRKKEKTNSKQRVMLNVLEQIIKETALN